jgi:hypothetical protein
MDEFTRIVCNQWFGSICPDEAQEEVFSWIHGAPGGRTLCTDMSSEAPRFFSHDALIMAAIDKFCPGHTDVRPIVTRTIFQGRNAAGDDVMFVFNFTRDGYYLSLSLLGVFRIPNI